MSFIVDTETFNGGKQSERVWCVRADNPSSMTYMGTNTYILAEPTSPECIVVDPAPSGEHIENVLNQVIEMGLRVEAIVATHCHSDHTEGIDQLEMMTGARRYAREEGSLPDGPFEPIEGGPKLEVISLPGHSEDSVGLVYPADKSVFAGDVVFRHGPTVVFFPSGHLGNYLAGLDKLQKLVDEGVVDTIYPGHGWPIADPTRAIKASYDHRMERLDQIKDALSRGIPADPDALFDDVYGDVPAELRWASLRSIQAQLVYLGFEQDPGALSENPHGDNVRG